MKLLTQHTTLMLSDAAIFLELHGVCSFHVAGIEDSTRRLHVRNLDGQDSN